MEKKRTKTQCIAGKVIACLQEEYYVTDGELVAKTLDPAWLRPQDVAHRVQARFGVLLPDQSYENWGEYVTVLSRAACRQGVKL